MTIDLQHFTPLSALAGGALIGGAAAWLILLNGRIAGISGIFAGALHPPGAEAGWRLLFLCGLLLAGVALPALGLPLLGLQSVPALTPPGDALVDATSGRHLAGLVIAGLLVGVGTRAAGGCTSGHGVCGLARGSLRSLVATATFMAAGVASVAVLRHLWS